MNGACSLNSWQKQLDCEATGRALSFYKWVRFLNRIIIINSPKIIIIYTVLLPVVKINYYINLHTYIPKHVVKSPDSTFHFGLGGTHGVGCAPGLGGFIMLCSWARHFTLSVPLLMQVCGGVLQGCHSQGKVRENY